jgi:hypothetical protein
MFGGVSTPVTNRTETVSEWNHPVRTATDDDLENTREAGW